VKDKNETETKERGKKRPKFIDLTDVPPQSPIIKSSSKDGTSKYTGVCFNKASKKWVANISVDGKQHGIGCYDNEEEAAIDYARAVSKYGGPVTTPRKGGKKVKRKFIDLTDVPPQPPILKSSSKDGASKYLGICFDKEKSEWVARISVDGKRHYIGVYDNEEEAAIDYARAVSKYKGGKEVKPKFIDLTDVPPQSPILSSKDGTSKYEGVFFNKASNKWQAQISFDGKRRYIGVYDNEEEAAGDYARAVLKYKGGKEVEPKFIDLTDVPPQSPILSSKDGTSTYKGVFFNKARGKWQAQIYVDGKPHHLGYSGNEEEAAGDYARAMFKYSVEVNQNGGPSAKHTEVKRELCSIVAGTNQTQNGGECRHHEPIPKRRGPTNHMPVNKKPYVSMELLNKGGRIGRYSPEERKARIARFHAKRSTRVCKSRVSYDMRGEPAHTRPKGRLVVLESAVGGEGDSA
jgi:hypothetical protein